MAPSVLYRVVDLCFTVCVPWDSHGDPGLISPSRWHHAVSLAEAAGGLGKEDEQREEDLLSRLPDDVLARVLSLVPLREAARASALSRTWRHLWKQAPGVELSAASMRGGRPGSYSADPEFAGRAAGGQDPKCREALGLVRERSRHRDALLSRREGGLVECAEGVLRARAAARVESLTVHLPLRGVHTRGRLDGWLGAAATPSLRVLVVDLLEVLGVEEQWREPGGEPYRFPCHLLSAGRAPSLVHLRLKFLALEPPPPPALLRTSLRGLDLDMVRVTDPGLLGVLNGCPLLQRLRLTRCDELATLRLHGGLLPRLRVLVVEDCCRLRKMVLSGSPLALLVLRYKGHRIQFAAAEGESAAAAAAADLLAWPFPRYLHYFSTQLATRLPLLHTLRFNFSNPAIKHSQVLTQLPMATLLPLVNLRRLAIWDGSHTQDSRVWLELLLNGAPRLETLELHLGSIFEAEMYKEIESAPTCKLHVKRVYIVGFWGGCSKHVQLAAYILYNGRLLELMVIEQFQCVVRDKDQTSIKLCRKAHEYLKNISSTVQLVIK